MKLSETFKEEIKKGILMAQSTDWGYNGEDEYPYDTFDEDVAIFNVVELIEKNIEDIDRGTILEEMKDILKDYITVHTVKHPEATQQLITQAMYWFDSKYKL
jgi:hypothetical protein